MPRSATAGELALLAGAAFNVHVRVWVANADGTYKNLNALGADSIDFVSQVEIDEDIDQPIAQCTLRLKRDVGVQSLSPLRTDSPLNVRDDGVTYAALVDAGRDMYVETAVVAAGGSPAAGDWKTMFVGIIDTITDDNAADATLEVKARDLGAYIADAWFATGGSVKYPYPGQPIETITQGVLNAGGMDGTITTVTLYTPISPSYNITEFRWGDPPESVLDAVLRLVQSIGADVRYRWDDGLAEFRFTLTMPDRTKTSPDAIIGPDQYISVDSFAIDRTDVRNDITVLYGPDDARASERRTDATSISRYKPRPIIDSEASESAINTATEAGVLADAILADLKDPKADQQITMLYYWPVQLGDLHRYSANGVHYNADQDLAVVHLKHVLGGNGGTQHRTTVDVRGKPAGAYLQWVARAAKQQQNLPDGYTVRATPTENAGTGLVTMVLADLTNIFDSTAVDGAITGAVSWHMTIAGVTTIEDSTTKPSVVVSGTYTKSVTLDPLHPILVVAVGHFIDGTSKTLGSWTFDYNKVSDVVNATAANSGTAATVTVDWDTDTAIGAGKARYSLDGGSTWTTTTVDASRQSQFDVTRTGSKQTAILQGVNQLDGAWGNQRTVEIDSTDPAAVQVPVAVFADGSWSALISLPTGLGSFRWLASTVGYPNDATTAASGNLVSGSPFTITSVLASLPLSAGQAVYITVVPFTGSSGSGTALTAVHGVGAYLPSNPQGTVGIDANGNWEATADLPITALSCKYIAQTSGFASDATVVSSGSIFTGASRVDLTGGPLSFGQTIYISIVPFTGSSGSGTQLPSIHIRNSYTSFSATKTVNYARVDLRRAYTFNPIGDPDYVSTDGSPSNPALAGAAVGPKSLGLSIRLVLPTGVTLVSASFDAVWNSATTPLNSAGAFVVKNGTQIASGSFTYGIGSQTVTISLSGSVGSSDSLSLKVNCFGPNTGGSTADADQLYFGDVRITYTMPDPLKTV